MGKGGIASIGITAGLTALSFGLAAPIAGIGFLGNAALGLGLGAAMGGLGLLVANKTPKTKRDIQDINFTTSIRNAPVPVLFGRGRVAGNYLLLGNFFRAATKRADSGSRAYIMHAIIGICEGPLQYIGNISIDGKKLRELSEETYKTDLTNLLVDLVLDGSVSGTPTETVAADLTGSIGSGKDYYATLTRPVPWRNTAKWSVKAIIGGSPVIASINGDAVGPDYAVRRAGSLGDTNQHDQIWNTSGTTFYDAYTESIYYTVDTSSTLSSPIGLAKVHRTTAGTYAQTQPPTAVSSDVAKAWYVGKHDVLVMQDPSDDGLFHIGYWGITRGSADWEQLRPHPYYDNAIQAMHLDELHAILHTLHLVGSDTYILRWNLLTGRVETLLIADLDGTATCMCYSPDFHCYVIADDGGSLRMVDADTGGLTHKNTTINLTNIRAVCTTGSRIGILKTSAFLYYDPSDSTVSAVYGSSSTNVTVKGAMGSIKASCQNTFTGQLLMGRYSAGDTNAEWNLFIPSVVEDLEDMSANGSPKEHEFQWSINSSTDCSPILNQSDETDWVRDWSWRKYSGYSQVALEGRSSLAAALYASITDYLSLDATITDLNSIPIDTKRWGAGIDASLVSLASFEALHAHCVGGVIYKNVLRTFNCDPEYVATDSSSMSVSLDGDGDENMVERWAERFKFDYLLDSETSAMSFALDTALPCCNGYLYFEDGKLHVGFPRVGAFAVWHFTTDQISDDTGLTINFNDRLGGVNQVRAQFLEVRDEYRINLPGEWNDEWMQNAVGMVRSQTLTLSGCGRHGQAELLAKLVGDQTVGTRQSFQFGTHYLGNVLSPSDVIEISDPGCGLEKKRFRVFTIGEKEDNTFALEGQEYNPIIPILRDHPLADPPPPGPAEACVGCGDSFEWATGDVSEHALGGSSVFIRSSDTFKICTNTYGGVTFEATSDDIVILHRAGEVPTQVYGGVVGNTAYLTLPANYIMFQPTTGSLRATATCEKDITDGTISDTIPSGSGGSKDQVTDLNFTSRPWTQQVTFAEMAAMGWVIDGSDEVALQFSHIVCGNGFCTITSFVCGAVVDFIAYNTSEETVAASVCDRDLHWWLIDPDTSTAEDLALNRMLSVPDGRLGQNSTDNPNGPGAGTWSPPFTESHWNSEVCGGQFNSQEDGSPPPLANEVGNTTCWTQIYIGSGIDLDTTEFPFDVMVDDNIGEFWVNGTNVHYVNPIDYAETGAWTYSSPGVSCRLRLDKHTTLAHGWNTIKVVIGSSSYARGFDLKWYAPQPMTP